MITENTTAAKTGTKVEIFQQVLNWGPSPDPPTPDPPDPLTPPTPDPPDPLDPPDPPDPPCEGILRE